MVYRPGKRYGEDIARMVEGAVRHALLAGGNVLITGDLNHRERRDPHGRSEK